MIFTLDELNEMVERQGRHFEDHLNFSFSSYPEDPYIKQTLKDYDDLSQWAKELADRVALEIGATWDSDRGAFVIESIGEKK